MTQIAASLLKMAGKTVTPVAFKKSFEQKINEAISTLMSDISATHRENGTKSVDSKRMMVEVERAKHDFKSNDLLDKQYELKKRIAPLSRSEKEDMGLGAQTGYGWVDFTK